jgi:hypothetical protein
VTNEGWTCPRCGSIWAPHVPGCFNCNADVERLRMENAALRRALELKPAQHRPVPGSAADVPPKFGDGTCLSNAREQEEGA